MAWQRPAGLGSAGRGTAGLAWLGLARHGTAWPGGARRGTAGEAGTVMYDPQVWAVGAIVAGLVLVGVILWLERPR
jgi:hypothetical protein